jgi:hypothetical protein
MRQLLGCSSVGDSMPSLEQTRHQDGITARPVGFCVIMNPPSSDERHVAPLHTKPPESNFAAGSSPRAKSGIARALMGADSVFRERGSNDVDPLVRDSVKFI